MKPRSYGIVGLGNFGSTVATELERFGNHVIGVDLDERRVGKHTEELSQALVLDACDPEALREAGLGECDVVLIAMASDLEASVMTAMNLQMIGAETIWAKATTKMHHRILSKLGVDRVIQPEVEVGLHISQMLHNPLVRDYVSLGNGYHVVNFRIPDGLQGKVLSELDHTSNYDLRCIGVMRGTEFLGRDGDECRLEEDDLLLLLGKRNDLRDFAASL